MVEEYFSVIAFVILAAAIDTVLAISALRRRGHWIGICLLFTAFTVIVYICSYFSKSYFGTSFFSSLHFSSITILLYAYERHIETATENDKKWKIPRTVFTIWTILDVLILLVNPFYEIAVSYRLVRLGKRLHFALAPGLLYYLHLLLCYLILFIAVVMVVGKIVRVTTLRRRQYYLMLFSIVLVVLLNAIYLFLRQTNGFDFSILFYSIAAVLVYWSSFYYEKRAVVSNVSVLVFEELNSPVILFDDENRYLHANKAAKQIMEQYQIEEGISLSELQMKIDLSDITQVEEREHHFLWRDQKAKKLYRVAVQRLSDKNDHAIAKVLTFTDDSLGIDIMTGFQNMASFQNGLNENDIQIEYPAGVAVCDLNRLGHINFKYGREMGDQLIVKMARILREKFPHDSYFVRLHDANLMILCQNATTDEMKNYLTEVERVLNQTSVIPERIEMQSAVSEVLEESNGIRNALSNSIAALRDRKLMDSTSSHYSLLSSFEQTLQESDDTTTQHVLRTKELGGELGKKLKLTDVELTNLQLLCLMHDVGKLGIPYEILNKQGKLTDEEWVIMRSHVEKGYRIASASEELQPIAPYILHHHEFWDGNGYPSHLRGEQIPMLSRIISVVDAYDAMTNDRPYRKAMSNEDALNELKRCAGTQFDPHVVDEFVKMLEN